MPVGSSCASCFGVCVCWRAESRCRLSSSHSFPFQLSSPKRLPNGPSTGLEDSELERQREGEIERQRAELSQLKERLALMCRQVSVSSCKCVPPLTSEWSVSGYDRAWQQWREVVVCTARLLVAPLWPVTTLRLLQRANVLLKTRRRLNLVTVVLCVPALKVFRSLLKC